MPRLRATPLVPAMSFKNLMETINQPFVGPCAVEVEPGHTESPVLPVEQVNPLVSLDQLVLPVPVVGGRGAIVWKPDEFRGVDDGGDTELIHQAWVVTVLFLDVPAKLLNFLLNRVIIPPF